MKNLNQFFTSLFVFSIIIIQNIYADNNKTSPDSSALLQTQSLLAEPAQRNKIIAADPKAKKADQLAQDLMGEHTQDMYKTAADLIPYLIEQSDNDPKKMNEILQQASRNPALFLEGLPLHLKSQISDLAKKAKPVKESKP